MPEYDYECKECNYSLSIVESIHSEAQTICPECQKKSFRRVILEAPMFTMKGEAKTLGQLADRNTQKMGKYELENRMQQDNMELHKKNKDVSAKRRRLNKMTPEQKRKWIMEGD